MEIKVLGPGCKNCKNLLLATQAALKEMGLDTEVIYVTDMVDIAAAGIMRTPGLIVNGKIKSTGRVPNIREIRQMIQSEI